MLFFVDSLAIQLPASIISAVLVKIIVFEQLGGNNYLPWRMAGVAWILIFSAMVLIAFAYWIYVYIFLKKHNPTEVISNERYKEISYSLGAFFQNYANQ